MTVAVNESRPARLGVRALLAGLIAGAPLWALAILITAAAWPFLDRSAAIGLDRSWQIALHTATWMCLREGVDVIFTYGPLGFLAVPQPYLGGTSLLALVATSGIYLSLVTVLLIEARRVVPLWAAALVVLAIARGFTLLPPFEAFQALVFIGCVEALTGRIRVRTPTVVAGFGIAAGIASLGKVNVGVFVTAMGAVTAMAIDGRWWRGVAFFAVAVTATGLVLWIASGQRLGDLVPFVSGSIQIINGYSEAMGTDRYPTRLWIYPAFIGIALLLGWTAVHMSVDLPRRHQIGLLSGCLILGFAMWKTAFTRENPQYAFATLLVGLAVVSAPLRNRRLWITSLLIAGVAFLAVAKPTLGSCFDLVASAQSLATETVTAVIPGRALRAEDGNRATLRSGYALDPATLAQLVGQRVSIDPVEAGIAFAYPEAIWDPLPVFQSYSAYTPALDRLNADRLASGDAPQRILRDIAFIPYLPDWMIRQRGHPLLPGELVPFVVDGRYRWFEAPAAMLQMFCRYRQLSATAKWQVLGLSGDNCGPPEPLGMVQAREGATVTVPIDNRSDRIVIVRVLGLEPSLADRVRTALFKANEWYVTIAGVGYRLVAATASDGLLLKIPPADDGTGPFAFGAPIRSLSIESDQADSQRILTYQFESIPLRQP